VRHAKRALIALSAALAASPVLAYLVGRWDAYWKYVTILGDEPAYVALSIALYTLADYELGFYALASLLTSGWVNVLLKNALALPRPPKELWKVEASGYGFPSGHAQTSAAFWSAASLKLRDPHLALLGAVVVGLVSYSRLELMVHYPRDVIGGAALGVAIAAATYYLLRASSRLSGRLLALALALYGPMVASLSALHPDATLPRVGGALAGLCCYPLVRGKLPKMPPSARLGACLAALLPSLLITRAVGSAHPLLQFCAYLLVVAWVVAAPLAVARAPSKVTKKTI